MLWEPRDVSSACRKAHGSLPFINIRLYYLLCCRIPHKPWSIVHNGIQTGKANQRRRCPLWLSFAVDDHQRCLITVINMPWCSVRIQNISHIYIRAFDWPTADWSNFVGTRLVHHSRGWCAREPIVAASINTGIPRILWILCILFKVLDHELLTTGTFSTM